MIICTVSLKMTAHSTDGRLLLRLAGSGDILGLSALRKPTIYRLTAKTLAP